MKKILALLLVAAMVLTFAGCVAGNPDNTKPSENKSTEPKPTQTTAPKFDPAAKEEGSMTYAQYDAAALDSQVVVECYVQAAQGWWFDSKANHGKITVYAQDPDGAYFIYEMACSEEDAAKLTKGTKIKVTGYKGTWAGEIEIMDATFEIVTDGTWVAEPLDVTSLLGTDELVKKQNMFVEFKGLTVDSIEYQEGVPGKDIYVNVSLNGNAYSFCVEQYLTGPDTDVYKAVQALEAGDVIDVEGFLYWYNGVNTHITSVSVAK